MFLAQIHAANLQASLEHVSAACLSDAVAEKLGVGVFKQVSVAKDRSAKALLEVVTR